MRTDRKRGPKASTLAFNAGSLSSGNEGPVYQDLQLIVCSVEIGGLFEECEILAAGVPSH
jgi:hypothetical protein